MTTPFITRAVTKRGLLTIAIILAVLATGYGLSSVRSATIAPGVVHLCVNSWTGDIRHVGAASQCTAGYVIDVNQQGVPGPQGPEGPQGPPGMPGQDGRPGATDFVVRQTSELIPATTHGSVVSSCLTGEVATGGGYWFSTENALLISYVGPEGLPETGERVTAWQANATNKLSTASVYLTVWVICASV